MTWPILIELSQYASSIDRWLHGLEPLELRVLPTGARAILYFLALALTLAVLRDTLKIIAWGVHRTLGHSLDFMAERILFDSLDAMAMIYVRMESLMLRLRIVHFRNEMLELKPPSRVMFPDWSISPKPVGSTAFDYIRAAVSMLAIAAALVITAPITLLKVIFRPTRVKIAAWLISLWYVGALAPVIHFFSTIRIGDIQLSVVVATGTLIAVIYAAANSDVRGRAELNKTASLACRTAMHGCTQPLLNIADNLHRIRKEGAIRLSLFPTRKDIAGLTGREDLEWRGSKLLPRGAGALPHHLRDSSLTRIRLVEVTLSFWFSRSERLLSLDSSLVSELDAEYYMSQIRESHKTIDDHMRSLREAGFIGKLDRVLDPVARGILIALYYDRFGLDDAELLVKAGEVGWLSKVMERQSDQELLAANWEELQDEPVDSLRMWFECYALSDLLKRFVRKEYEDWWGTALTEYRLMYLARSIDKTLRPRAVERVRQAFGK